MAASKGRFGPVNVVFKNLPTDESEAALALTSDDGCYILWFKQEHGYLEIQCCPENAPVWHIGLARLTHEELLKHVLKKCDGFNVVLPGEFTGEELMAPLGYLDPSGVDDAQW